MTSKRHVREEIRMLYRGLVKGETLDRTYERERMRVMQMLSLLPTRGEKNEMETLRPASAHLGLYARHRPKSSNSKNRNSCNPSMNKKVKDTQHGFAHSPYTEVSIRPKRECSGTYSPLCDSPKRKTLKQKGESNSVKQNRNQKSGNTHSLKKSQRLSTDLKSSSRKRSAKSDVQYSRNGDFHGCKSSFQSDSKWPEVERRRLNELYWELGKPKRSGRTAMNDHLESYVRRHQVIFKDRPAKEIKDRVRHMLQYNQFKEIAEEKYWRSFQ